MSEASMIMLSMMWVMLSAEPNEVYMGYNYKYNRMMEACEMRAGRACCRASVRYMQQNELFPTTVKEGCEAGMKMTSLPCPASMVWCEIPEVTTSPIAAKVTEIKESLSGSGEAR